MSKNESVKSQEPRAKRRKTKIVKWEYVTKPFDVHVDPDTVNRVHSLLERSLSWNYTIRKFYLHLRPCVQGVDEYGAVVKYLYCTRDGRFFVRGKDGWDEELPSNASKPRYNSKCGGAYDAPSMSHFGHKYCHRCVAFAWLDVPEDVKLQMIGVDAPTKWEVDHLNTDHKNWSADNLQWVTAEENRRRGKIAKRMRKIGLNPKLLTPTLCKGIYTLPEGRSEELIGRFLIVSKDLGTPMDVISIRLCVATALDWMAASAHELNDLNEN